MTVFTLIVAAGSGLRAKRDGESAAKQYRLLNGQPVLRKTLSVFCDHEEIDAVQVVIHPDHAGDYEKATGGLRKLRPPVPGGPDRMASVRCGLEAMSAHPPEIVLIHDAARPFLTGRLVSRVIAMARARGGALPVLPIPDTVKRIAPDETVGETLDRSTLRLAQTPQTFRFDTILDAHRRAAELGLSFTDDACVAEWAGLPIGLVEGETANRKLTTAADFDLAISAAVGTPAMTVRVGNGIDVHAFGPGNAVRLGGVDIPHGRALKGHSDADVVLHVLTDALLGTISDGDIGSHFPPSDPAWRGADSEHFLRHAAELVRQCGGMIDHVDTTILCQEPKIGPYRDRIRASIAGMLDLTVGRVSVKATTTERLGFAGRGEGIVAMANATVRLPEEG